MNGIPLSTCRLVGILLVITCSAAVAQEPVDERSGRGKVLQMVRTDTPPVIDGVMDEVWSTGSLMEDLHQVNPIEYSEPSEKTVVRFLYDEDFLYVSAMNYYGDPSQVIANRMIQGANLRWEDKFRLYINPFNDGRTGYLFQTNANGVRTDGIIENVTGRNFDWTGIWFADAALTEYGWFAEMAIPYKTISFDPNSDSWGISVFRTIESKSEQIAWTSYNRNTDPSNFGTAVGFEGLHQGMGLDVIPGVSATGVRDYDPRSTETELEPHMDVFYKFTPNLTGALTFNSDFSATDVDARQVQLTRFNLFFPEQRKFFLQEADIFEFGGLAQNGKPFFSRRMGIGPGGQQLDLEAGGKLTGRIGRWNVGALAVKQGGNADDLPPGGQLINDSELFVGRVSANVLGQSTVGLIATHGNPTGDASNSLIGADFNYLNTRTFEGVTLEGQAWFQQSETDGLVGDDSAWGVKLVSPNQQGFKGRIGFSSIGENFFPALGFVNRRGIEQAEAAIGYVKRYGRGSPVRSLENFFEYARITDTNGNVETEKFEAQFLKLQNQSNDEAFLLFTDNREVLTEPFTISEGVTIPVGDYSFQRYGAEITFAGQRDINGTLHLEDGGFFGGDRRTASARVEWQPNKYFKGVFEYEFNDIDLPEGEFITRLMRLNTEVAFNTEWAWITTVQFDNQSDLLGVNSRLQWIPRAGREFYIIYNGGWIDEINNGFDVVGQSATIKLNHTFRF